MWSVSSCHFPSTLLPIFTSASCFNKHHPASFFLFFFALHSPWVANSRLSSRPSAAFPLCHQRIASVGEKPRGSEKVSVFFSVKSPCVWTVNFRRCAKTWAAEFRLLGILHIQHATGLVSREKWIIEGEKNKIINTRRKYIFIPIWLELRLRLIFKVMCQ